MTLRKIDTQDGGQRVYRVPVTDHWADWRDADAVAHHGTLVAIRSQGDVWRDQDREQVSRDQAARYGALQSVGISTRVQS